MDYRN